MTLNINNHQIVKCPYILKNQTKIKEWSHKTVF